LDRESGWMCSWDESSGGRQMSPIIVFFIVRRSEASL
jgi:hypothetical protein